jgi:hypothetical protein
MNVFGINTQTLKVNLKYVIVPVAVVLIASIFIIFAIKTGFTRVPLMFDQLRTEQQNNDLLAEKLNILEKLRNDVISRSDSSVVAFPISDSVLWFMNVLKSSAETNQIELVSLDFKRSLGELNTSTFELQIAAGNRKDLLTFMTDLKNRAPISSIEEISFETNGEEVISNVKIVTYWKPLPEKIPSVSQPITDLTQNEEEILRSVINLRGPEFTTLDPDQHSDRTNPFN